MNRRGKSGVLIARVSAFRGVAIGFATILAVLVVSTTSFSAASTKRRFLDQELQRHSSQIADGLHTTITRTIDALTMASQSSAMEGKTAPVLRVLATASGRQSQAWELDHRSAVRARARVDSAFPKPLTQRLVQQAGQENALVQGEQIVPGGFLLSWAIPIVSADSQKSSTRFFALELELDSNSGEYSHDQIRSTLVRASGLAITSLGSVPAVESFGAVVRQPLASDYLLTTSKVRQHIQIVTPPATTDLRWFVVTERDRYSWTDYLNWSGFASMLVAFSLLTLLRQTFRNHAQRLYDAHTDELTGLPSRRLLKRAATEVFETSARNNEPCSLIMIDLNRFKEVNDTFGHTSGDDLLVVVAHRFRDAVREGDVVARLGGDEFCVLVPRLSAEHHPDQIADLAQRLLQSLDDPICINGTNVHIGASMGIASFPSHGDDVEAVLRQADVAMYEAKRRSAGWMVYDATREPDRLERLEMVNDLAAAIECGHIDVYFQPKVSLTTRRIEGVEALARWNDPRRGWVSPTEFVPLAEANGLIDAMTELVLIRAVDAAAAWSKLDDSVGVAVNVSSLSLIRDSFARLVADQVARVQLAPGKLTLEITEGLVMADPAKASAILAKVRESGVRVSIDDFGTGYSSLAYLRRLPLDELKIDRSFVTNIDNVNDPSSLADLAIVRSTIDLGHSVGLTVVAEGVETVEQLSLLINLGCDLVQGYVFAKPMPLHQITPLLGTQLYDTLSALDAGAGLASVEQLNVGPLEPETLQGLAHSAERVRTLLQPGSKI